MENQLNNIRACWLMAQQWEDWLSEYKDECEARGVIPNPIYCEELHEECNHYYHRYVALADAFCREHGGYISCGHWSEHFDLAA